MKAELTYWHKAKVKNRKEIPYNYVNVDKLIEDFKNLIFENMGVKL